MKRFLNTVASAGRFLFVLLILIGAFVFAMFQGGTVSWTIFYAILPFIIYSIALFLYPLSAFSAKRTLHAKAVQNGEKLSVTVWVKRKFPFPLLYTVIGDEWKNPVKQNVLKRMKTVVVFGWKRTMEWQYEIDKLPRGEYIAPAIRIEVTDFLGWIRKSAFLSSKDTLLVYPRTIDVEYIPIEAQHTGGLAASPFNFIKDTTMATGVRDYQFGDRVSWIHWKSFARTQTLMTKEFDDRSTQELSLVFDSRPSEMFEELVEFAASILQGVVTARLGVSFFPLGQEQPIFISMNSEEQFRTVLTYLARIQPFEHTGEPSVDLKKELENGGSVVLITARPNWSYLEPIVTSVTQRSSMICFVIVKNRASITSNLLEEIKYAQSKGVAVHPIVRKQFSTAFREVTHS